MKPKPKTHATGNGDVPQFELTKRLTIAKTKLAEDQAQGVRTREKANRLQLAKARGDLIEKNLCVNQLERCTDGHTVPKVQNRFG